MANPLITNYDIAKIFLGFEQRTGTATYTNATGSEVTLAAGTVLGRVHSTNKVYPSVSSATDGSQVPRFILADTYVVANGANQTVTYAYTCTVNSDLITLGGSDTLATVISLTGTTGSPAAATSTPVGTVRDLLQSAGIYLVEGIELTEIDNPQS